MEIPSLNASPLKLSKNYPFVVVADRRDSFALLAWCPTEAIAARLAEEDPTCRVVPSIMWLGLIELAAEQQRRAWDQWCRSNHPTASVGHA